MNSNELTTSASNTGPKKSALFFGITSVTLIFVGAAFLWISNAIIADTGYAIAAFLIVLPLLLVVGGALGLTAIILAIVVAVKSKRLEKSYILVLILGVISFLLAPLSVLILVWAAG